MHPKSGGTSSVATTGQLVDDCFRRDPRDEERLSHDDVIAHLRDRIQPIVGAAQLTLDEAAGRVVAQDVTAPLAVPGHTNSAVDGYALAHAGIERSSVSEMPVEGRATAGHPWGKAVAAGTAVRIFTGAVVPDGCDSVIMQEDCEAFDRDGASMIRIPPGLKRGANVRAAGEDVDRGDIILHKGDTVRPQDLAALASVGCASLSCYEKLRVAVVSTGDEVVRAGASRLQTGQVYDTNSPMLAALCANAGSDFSDLGIWPDQQDDLLRRLKDAAQSFDVVLTSGGASQGEEDHMALAIDQLGTRHFWQIAVKPGRPLMFGQIGKTIVVGLPGNPVAVFVCYLMYVQPLLRRLAGAHWPTPRRFKLPAAFSVQDRKLGRREFWRATTVDTEHGPAVQKYPRDGSGLVSSLRAANGLIDIPEHLPGIDEGQLVDFIPFTEFGITV